MFGRPMKTWCVSVLAGAKKTSPSVSLLVMQEKEIREHLRASMTDTERRFLVQRLSKSGEDDATLQAIVNGPVALVPEEVMAAAKASLAERQIPVAGRHMALVSQAFRETFESAVQEIDAASPPESNPRNRYTYGPNSQRA
jgi:hypothetical protein